MCRRSLSNKMVMQVGYVGSIGRKLAAHVRRRSDYGGRDMPPALPIHAVAPQPCHSFTFSTRNTRRNLPLLSGGIPWYLSVAQQASTGASSYHSLQVSLQQQLSHGLYFTLAYTYSHALDDYSGYESSYGNGTPNGVGFLNGRAINLHAGIRVFELWQLRLRRTAPVRSSLHLRDPCAQSR